MRKFWVLGFAVVFGALIVAVPVMAVSEQTDTTGPEQEAVPTDTVTEQAPAETAEDKATARAERLKQYQEKVAEKLSDAKAERLASRCKAAQGKITSLRAKLNNVVANRKKVYQEIGDKLNTLLLKLQAADIDVTALETAIADVKVELEALNTSMEEYDTVLSDLETMDCEADPDAFNTALSEARETQKQLREQAIEFRRFSTTELKEIIKELRAQLSAKSESTPEQEVTETTGE